MQAQAAAESANERPRWLERSLEAMVAVAALATIPLTVAQESGADDPLLAAADWAIWAVFLGEYTVMALLAQDRAAYTRRNWLSVLVIVLSFPALPTVLQLVRLFRLLRLVVVTGRALRALRLVLARPGLVYVALMSLILIAAGGGAMAVIEPQTVKGGLGDGLWWAIVTATTVGYGDISPSTSEGRVLAVGLMLAGIGLVSTLAASITAYFVEQEGGAERRTLEERLTKIEALLEDLVRSRDHEQSS